MTLARTVQSLQPGDLVELFELDLSPIGVDEVWRFTPTPNFAPGDDDIVTALPVKLKSTPLVRRAPVRSSGAGPMFFNSMNSKSSALSPAASAGWYMSSVMRR